MTGTFFDFWKIKIVPIDFIEYENNIYMNILALGWSMPRPGLVMKPVEMMHLGMDAPLMKNQGDLTGLRLRKAWIHFFRSRIWKIMEMYQHVSTIKCLSPYSILPSGNYCYIGIEHRHRNNGVSH
jgi:hypothetical protein